MWRRPCGSERPRAKPLARPAAVEIGSHRVLGRSDCRDRQARLLTCPSSLLLSLSITTQLDFWKARGDAASYATFGRLYNHQKGAILRRILTGRRSLRQKMRADHSMTPSRCARIRSRDRRHQVEVPRRLSGCAAARCALPAACAERRRRPSALRPRLCGRPQQLGQPCRWSECARLRPADTGSVLPARALPGRVLR